MEKLNKVIVGLECCLSDADCDKCCPYFKGEYKLDGCMDEMMAEALEILRGDRGDWIRLSDLMKFPIRIDHYDKVNGNEHFVYGVETVLEYAENLPRVEAEPVVHAHWVKLPPDQRDYFTDYTHCCSKCGERGKKHYKRCRECGAVMDEKMPPEPTPLIRLDLGGRINKRLKQMGVTTVEQLEAMDKHTLHNIPGLGRRSIETIESELRIWKEKQNELLER